MFSQRVGQIMVRERLVIASSATSVIDAARLMAAAAVGAVVVVDGGAVVGIFSERDAVYRVIAAGREPLATCLSEVMTPDPVTVEPGRSYGHALRRMQEHGFRHMPVVDGGKLLGIVSARNVLDPDMEEFVSEQSRRESFD